MSFEFFLFFVEVSNPCLVTSYSVLYTTRHEIMKSCLTRNKNDIIKLRTIFSPFLVYKMKNIF